MKLQWNELPDDRNPEFPDPLPNESTVIARSITRKPGEEVPELTQQQREDLADEIEFDLL